MLRPRTEARAYPARRRTTARWRRGGGKGNPCIHAATPVERVGRTRWPTGCSPRRAPTGATTGAPTAAAAAAAPTGGGRWYRSAGRSARRRGRRRRIPGTASRRSRRRARRQRRARVAAAVVGAQQRRAVVGPHERRSARTVDAVVVAGAAVGAAPSRSGTADARRAGGGVGGGRRVVNCKVLRALAARVGDLAVGIEEHAGRVEARGARRQPRRRRRRRGVDAERRRRQPPQLGVARVGTRGAQRAAAARPAEQVAAVCDEARRLVRPDAVRPLLRRARPVAAGGVPGTTVAAAPRRDDSRATQWRTRRRCSARARGAGSPCRSRAPPPARAARTASGRRASCRRCTEPSSRLPASSASRAAGAGARCPRAALRSRRRRPRRSVRRASRRRSRRGAPS